MDTIKIVIKKTSDDHDSDVVGFIVNGELRGMGYRAKDTGKICIERCPKCDRENYAINKPTGTCAFCGLDANKL